jgi:DNA processing protein
MDINEALLLLAHVIEPNDERMQFFIEEVGPIDAIEAIRRGSIPKRESEGLQARLRAFSFAAALRELDRCSARLVFRDSSEWPTQLNDLGHERPFVLWVVGTPDVRLSAVRSLSMVGARDCTPYGRFVASDWSARFSDKGWVVISGGALGIDGAAHQGVLSVGGVTMCVLACGVDVSYPRAHESLLANIADTGLLISESPPGSPAMRQRFLSRNRIIASLSRGTVVVEAGSRSGTTSTANFVNRLNRPLFAVPGAVTSPASTGCHQLINEGKAILATQWQDVAAMLGDHQLTLNLESVQSHPTDGLTPRQKQVLDAVPLRRGKSADVLMLTTGLSLREVLSALGVLEVKGFIRQEGQLWRLVRA